MDEAEEYGRNLEALWVQCLATFLGYLASVKGLPNIRKAILVESYREDFMTRMTQRNMLPKYDRIVDMETARMFALATMANGEVQ